MEKEIEQIWFDNFGNKQYAYDLDNNLILKSHFNTNSVFSWNEDIFSNSDKNQKYIASTNFINQRNNRKSFLSNSKISYEIKEDIDNKFFWTAKEKILDDDQILNLDNFINYIIDKDIIEKNLMITISFKKLEPLIETKFIEFIYTFLKNENYLTTKTTTISDMVFAKFLFKVNNELQAETLVNKLINLSSLIPLFIYRATKKYENIWVDKQFIKKGYYFNIIAFEILNNNNLNVMDLIDVENFISVYKNTIFINEDLKNTLINFGYKSHFFTMANEVLRENFSKLDIQKNSFQNYLLKIKNQK